MDGSNQRNYNADHYNIPLSPVRPEPHIPVRPELVEERIHFRHYEFHRLSPVRPEPVEGRTSIGNTSTLSVIPESPIPIPAQAGIQNSYDIYFSIYLNNNFFFLSSLPVTSRPSLLKKERGLLENGI
jgi:hypothetical protein